MSRRSVNKKARVELFSDVLSLNKENIQERRTQSKCVELSDLTELLYKLDFSHADELVSSSI